MCCRLQALVSTALFSLRNPVPSEALLGVQASTPSTTNPPVCDIGVAQTWLCCNIFLPPPPPPDLSHDFTQVAAPRRLRQSPSSGLLVQAPPPTLEGLSILATESLSSSLMTKFAPKLPAKKGTYSPPLSLAQPHCFSSQALSCTFFSSHQQQERCHPRQTCNLSLYRQEFRLRQGP